VQVFIEVFIYPGRHSRQLQQSSAAQVWHPSQQVFITEVILSIQNPGSGLPQVPGVRQS
jgi:hypothetical protein